MTAITRTRWPASIRSPGARKFLAAQSSPCSVTRSVGAGDSVTIATSPIIASLPGAPGKRRERMTPSKTVLTWLSPGTAFLAPHLVWILVITATSFRPLRSPPGRACYVYFRAPDARPRRICPCLPLHTSWPLLSLDHYTQPPDRCRVRKRPANHNASVTKRVPFRGPCVSHEEPAQRPSHYAYSLSNPDRLISNSESPSLGVSSTN